MSITPNFEFTKNTNIFLKFIMDLFIDSSDDISEILLFKSDNTIHQSGWKNSTLIYDLAEKWKKCNIPSNFTLNDVKFIKLHDSPFNLIYRSIKGQNALIGTKFRMISEEMMLFAIVKQTETMQLGLTAMKDIIISIIELGQKMSDIIVTDSHNLQIGIKFPENKQVMKLLIESLKILQFVCEYTDRGDSVNLNFRYEKKDKKIYPDYMYK